MVLPTQNLKEIEVAMDHELSNIVLGTKDMVEICQSARSVVKYVNLKQQYNELYGMINGEYK